MYKTRILVNGKPIHKYHDRQGNIWVEARYGTRYAIEVKNDSWKRALAIVSVDGLNVVNGKHEEPNKSTGYVISPFNNVIVKGWRISSKQIKEFYFTSPENSYSAKLGANVSNVGVIGCVVYEEVPEPIAYSSCMNHSYMNMPYNTGYLAPDKSTTACSCSANVLFQSYETKMATGSGNKVEDHSSKVHFGKKVFGASMTIYYDSRENLEKRGVIRDDYQDELPRPFPNEKNYCPDL